MACVYLHILLVQLKEEVNLIPRACRFPTRQEVCKGPIAMLKTPTGTGYRVGCSLVCVGQRLPKKGLVTGWLVQLGIKIYYDNVSALT